MRLRSASWLVALCIGLSPLGSAAADRETAAAEMFKTAATAYDRGEFRAAALGFEAAYREKPRGPSMFNAGLAWEAAKEKPRAADDYEAALANGDLPSDQARQARQHLAALERALGRLDIATRGGLVSVEQAERAPSPAHVHVAPGEHEVRVVYPDGRTANRIVEVAAGQTLSVDFDPAPAETAPAPSPASSAPVAAPRATAPLRKAPDRATRRDPAFLAAGWVALGASVAAGGAAIGLGFAALDARDTFDASAHTDRDARDRADRLRTFTNVAWIGAGALAITGVTLLIAAPRKQTSGATPASLSLRVLSITASY